MSKMSARTRIERSREARLWVGTAIKAVVGAATVYSVVNSSPELKCKVEGLKFEVERRLDKVKSWFKK